MKLRETLYDAGIRSVFLGWNATQPGVRPLTGTPSG